MKTTVPERPVSVDKKMEEQLEEFDKKVDNSSSLPGAPPIRYEQSYNSSLLPVAYFIKYEQLYNCFPHS